MLWLMRLPRKVLVYSLLQMIGERWIESLGRYSNGFNVTSILAAQASPHNTTARPVDVLLAA